MPNTGYSRRRWLQSAGGLAGGVLLQSAYALEAASRPAGRFILVFLRGGLDGLFAFAPTADPRLAALRPTLASESLAHGIALGNSGFAAHPAGQALAGLYSSRELAFAPCFGTTDRSRSHFQAQDLFELGNGSSQGGSGLLARASDAGHRQLQAVSFTSNTPLILQGGTQIPEVAPLSGNSLKMRPGRALDAIRAMHERQPSGVAIEQAINTQSELDSARGMDPTASRGAARINNFPQAAETMARLLRDNLRLALAFIDIGGFDTHSGEANVLARSLPLLGQGLLSLREGLGSTEWRRTQILVCTEFGRTVRENGTQGTDHGHGSLALLIGGAIGGGQQIGGFEGLRDASLHEGRDLPVTVDWRSLIGRALRDTQSFDNATLEKILPGMPRLG
jgi:uncharacterized protein (DUF1501 family)